MTHYWPALCTALALIALLVLVIRYQWHAFLALLVVSLGLGLAAGMSPPAVVDEMAKGVAGILREVAVLLALGAILGRLLETSGAAEVIARTLVSKFGVERAPLAILLAGFLIGIPVLFNVGFLVLVPIMYRLQKQTGRSLLFYLLPLAFSLGLCHSLIPPHPGIVGAITTMGGATPDRVNRTMVEAILFGSLLALPLMTLGWLGPGRWWARRQHVECPPVATGGPPVVGPGNDAAHKPDTHATHAATPPDVPFAAAVLIVTLPLLLSLIGFGAKILADLKRLPEWMSQPLVDPSDLPVALAWLGHTPLKWLEFLGKPAIALLAPTLLAVWLLGVRRGVRGARLNKLAEDSLRDVGSMVFLFGAAGAFKEVIQASKGGEVIARLMMDLPLSPVATCYIVAVIMRVALGSATASILTAAALLADFARQFPGQETLLVLAVANGVTFMTQPADSGFWMLKEFGNLSVRDVMIRVNGCRMFMSLCGVTILILCEMFIW